ncbi:MFS transporter [Actinomadura sp. NAK00032]|uniref:MFS transporter n=1 Tax=Actinomadura sp. NAK00032 TaxID=2742128 RepID=UPI0015919E32|nr:MFS transporter [Actinomadura sp. NAK00032]QKW38931.1 MFS transporter [Actinomadura sp. NAK00032]
MTAAAPGMASEDSGEAGANGADDDYWRRDFRLLLSGSVLSQLGTLGAAAANPLLALALTGSPIVAGWVAAASTLPGLLLHLPVGLLVDRSDRWRIMLYSQVIRVINSVVLVVVLCTLPTPWPMLVAAAVIDGSCAVFFRMAELATVRYVVPDGKAENAMGTSEARHHLAIVLGRPVGGMMFTLGRAAPYVLDGLTSLVSVFSLLALKSRLKLLGAPPRKLPKLSEVSAKRILDSFKEGFRWIYRDRFLSVSLGACAIANIGFQVVILLLVVEAERRDFSGSVIGTMLATSGVAGFLGAATAPAMVRFLTPGVTVKCGVVLWLPCLVVVAGVNDPLVGLCAWGACSFMGAHVNVALAVYQGRVIPRRVLGRVEGIHRFITTGAVTFGALSGGYVIAALGTRLTAALVSVAFGVIGVAAAVLIRTPDRRAWRQATPVSARRTEETVPAGRMAVPVGGDT